MASAAVVCTSSGWLRLRSRATTRRLFRHPQRAQRIRDQERDAADGDAWTHRARQRLREGRKDRCLRRERCAPATATVIDAEGKYVTPGIIDPHSHMALDNDVNEATSPVVPQMMMKDAFDYNDKAIYRALAGGVTSSLLLHGSADMIGGQAVVIKNEVRTRPRSDAVSGSAAVDQVRQRREPQARIRRQEAVAIDPHGQLRGDARGVHPGEGLSAPVGRVQREGQARRQERHDAEEGPEAGGAVAGAAGQNAGADPLLPRGRVPDRDRHRQRVWLQDSRLPSCARGVQGAGRAGPERHRHCDLRRLVGLQVRSLGRDSVERGDCDAAWREGRDQERQRRLHAAAEPGSGQDHALRRRDRGRSHEDADHQSGVDHRRG